MCGERGYASSEELGQMTSELNHDGAPVAENGRGGATVDRVQVNGIGQSPVWGMVGQTAAASRGHRKSWWDLSSELFGSGRSGKDDRPDDANERMCSSREVLGAWWAD